MRGMRRWIPWVLVAVLMLATAAVLWNRLAPGPRDQRFDREVRAAARLYGVDPALIKAVIWKESTFKPSARGKVGEIGLMQLREPAAVEWSTSEGVSGFELEHLLNPRTNILAGTWYLARLMRRYTHTDDPVPYALADYNAGRANVLRWIKADGANTNAAVFVTEIGFPGTRHYVGAVMERRERYRTAPRSALGPGG